MSDWRRILSAAAVAAGLWRTGAALAVQPAVPAATVDPSECRSCHEAAMKVLETTRHNGVAGGCQACHVGVPEHLQSMADKGEPGAIVYLRKQPADAVNESCETCHDKGKVAHYQGGPHDRRGVSCASCHSVHGFKSETAMLKTAREPETCYSCHPQVRARMNRVSHHPVREGAMACSSCHDTHGSNPKLVAADWVNETCYKCHAEKRGPFLWEHAPARDNCLNCHDPHGTNHRGLLINKPPYLCQRCHLNTLHAAVMYDGRDTPRGSAPTAYGTGRACTNCHRSIHGTNAPSATILTR